MYPGQEDGAIRFNGEIAVGFLPFLAFLLRSQKTRNGSRLVVNRILTFTGYVFNVFDFFRLWDLIPATF
jgi:hypothetical protein